MSNEEQKEYWNGSVGEQWAAQDDTMARILAPVAELLLQDPRVASATRALNIGCGGGSETCLLATAMGGESRVTGIDISEPLVAVARNRLAAQPELAGRVDFRVADASNGDLGGSDYDLMFSRFGVMFFDDPVGAFTHLRGSAAAGGQLLFACWQALAQNPWVAAPLQAALTILPPPPRPDPNAPGPFAFADAARTTSILKDAGWSDVAIRPETIHLVWDSEGDLMANTREMLKVGPVGRLIMEAEPDVREQVFEVTAKALEPFADGSHLRVPGNIWVVTATA